MMSAPLMTPLSAALRTSTPQILRSPQRPADIWHSKQVGYAAFDLLERKTCTSLLKWALSLAGIKPF